MQIAPEANWGIYNRADGENLVNIMATQQIDL